LSTVENVLEFIEGEKDNIVSLMQKLVQIPSISGEEEEVGQLVCKMVKSFGLEEAEIVQDMANRPNVIARYRGTKGTPTLTVYAHYDTVPPGDISQWDYGPYSGEIEGDRIYGRGVKDHKFPIPPLLYALKAIKDAGLKLEGDIVFAFVCDEERGGHHGTKLLVDRGLLDTDMMLYSGGGGNGESIGIASNGREYYRIKVKGVTAHTGNNDQGVNAINKAAKLITRLEALEKDVNERRDEFDSNGLKIKGKARFSINYVHAFVTGNNVPDECIVQIDRRFIPKVETPESCRQEIQSILDKLAEEDPDFNAEMITVPDRSMEPAWSFPDSTLVDSLSNSVEKILGTRPIVSDMVGGGSSDWGWYMKKYPNRPVVSYGCSRGGPSHGYNEYATISGLLDNTKIYALLFMELLSVDKSVT
jgi:acetylornithine deacetylase/succinyl-diaminopimelate desuccinylase family protein